MSKFDKELEEEVKKLQLSIGLEPNYNFDNE